MASKTHIKYDRPFLYPYQKAFMDNPERFTVIEASTKIGKTAALIIWLFEMALNGRPGHKFWWVAPVYAQAKIAFERMKRQITIPGFFKVNIAELTLTLPNGAVIEFKSADKPDNLYGEDVYAAVFDEFTRAKEAAQTALYSTLTSTHGKCKYIGNVRGRGWGYQLAQKAKNGNDPRYSYHRITCWDAVCTGLLDPDEVRGYKDIIISVSDNEEEEVKAQTIKRRTLVYEQLLLHAIQSQAKVWKKKARLSLDVVIQALTDFAGKPEAFRELYEALPSDDGGNPFGVRFLAACEVDGLSTKPDAAIGIDLAKTVDFTAFVGLDEDKRVCRLTRFQLNWKLTPIEMAKLPYVDIHVDQTGVGNPVVENFQSERDRVKGFTFTKSSKQPLLEALVIAIRRGEIKFPRGTVLADELYSFEYEHTANGVRYSAPEGLHDDTVMALALAYNAYRRQIPDSNTQAFRPTPKKKGF